jgi:DNA repair photolyase
MKNPIYKPRGRAAEYSHLALTLYKGCDNGCTYCYAPYIANRYKPTVLHVSREEFAKCRPRKGILEALALQAMTMGPTNERTLICFCCDPYPSIECNEQITASVLCLLNTFDLPFQILTKSGSRALNDIKSYGPKDAFASTLTFINPGDSKKWEPNAALPADRMETLRKFHEAGIHTWVSLEPVIDPEQTLELVRQTANFVDLYKVGKLNYVKSDTDWRMFGARAIKILESLNKPYFIKSDLAEYLTVIPFRNTDNRMADVPKGQGEPILKGSDT